MKPLILAIHYIFRLLVKVVSVEKCRCMCMQSLLLILFIYLSAIEKIMEKNNENTQNNESKFREWLQCQQGKSKTNIIFKKTYDAIVAHLKILNQEIDGHDFPEKIKKRVRRNQYELMNYLLFNLKDILCVPSKDKRKVSLYKSFI